MKMLVSHIVMHFCDTFKIYVHNLGDKNCTAENFSFI